MVQGSRNKEGVKLNAQKLRFTKKEREDGP